MVCPMACIKWVLPVPAAIEEEWVVRFGRLFRHSARSGVRKFVGFADNEGIESVASVELVIAAFEIELGLLGRGYGRRSLDGLLFGADILHFGVGSAHLVENGLDDLAVGPGKDLSEDGAGNLNKKGVALAAAQPGGLEPGVVGVDTDAGLYKVEKFVPGILHFVFSAKLGSGRHRVRKNQIPANFHRCEYAVESRCALKLLALEFLLAPGKNP